MVYFPEGEEHPMPGTHRFTVMGLCIGIFVSAPCAWKKEIHYLTLPLVEGCGVYASTRILQDSNSWGSKASAITGLSLLGIEAGLASVAIFGAKPDYPRVCRIHRFAGYALAAAAVWMSISAANDGNVENRDRNFAHGYAIAAVMPVVIFSF
jgi:hypothetical protein